MHVSVQESSGRRTQHSSKKGTRRVSTSNRCTEERIRCRMHSHYRRAHIRCTSLAAASNSLRASRAGTETIPDQGSRALIIQQTYRLYRSRFCKCILSSYFAAFFEINDIFTLVHRFKLKIFRILLYYWYLFLCKYSATCPH